MFFGTGSVKSLTTEFSASNSRLCLRISNKISLSCWSKFATFRSRHFWRYAWPPSLTTAWNIQKNVNQDKMKNWISL